jgi:hypothetical protein
MTDENDLARRIVERLDEGAVNMGRTEREKLHAARQAALARYRVAPAAALAPALAGNFSRFMDRQIFGIRHLVPLAALVLGLAAVVYIHSNGGSPDIADIDAALLTDELPIDAYLDKGFDTWLKRSPR